VFQVPDLIQPLGGRVLVRIQPEENVTRSGLCVPDTAREKPQRGVVAAVGDDQEAIKVSVGDRVLFPKYTGTEISIESEDHLIIESAELLAVIRDKEAGAQAA
jgi:chaperonin GroES